MARISTPIQGPTEWPLSGLLLDKDNPRFGLGTKGNPSQADILDRIVDRFSVDDVLSSLAMNGYFRAEPMVCRRGPDKASLTVAEGNRRLAACLILVGDERASRQKRRTEVFQPKWKAAGSPKIDPVPVIIFEGENGDDRLLSYLGVRHISSSQPWDSYAKAAWVAKVVEDNRLQVADVADMIGDEHRTIQRLLEGYYVIQQLIDAGEFRPEDSIRRGRGSVTEYPFSWVYTILGYSTVRRFFGIDDETPLGKNPVPQPKLSDTGLVVRAMFGDKAKGRNAAVEDSRELSELSSVVADPQKVDLLAQGKPVAEIIRLTKPIDTRLREGLSEVRTLQSELLASVTADPPARAIAEGFVEPAAGNQRLAAELADKLRKSAGRDGG